MQSQTINSVPPRRAPTPQPLHAAQLTDALLQLRIVTSVTGLSPSSIYRKVDAGSFPKPVRLGPRCVRWRSGDVQEWMRAL